MIKAGVLDGVDSVYCIHVDPTLGVGRYGLLDGAITAASDRFDVYVRHEGSGHSARPHEGTDTVWVATQIINAFYQLAGRITDARNATVLSVCRLFGSEAHNVIPDTVEFGGTLRTTSTEDRKMLRQKMAQIAKQTAATFGATANMEVEKGAPPVINEPLLIKNVEDVVREAYGPQAIYEIPQSSMGGEDFSYYLDHVPGALIRVGTASSPETSHPLHDHRFDIDETPLAPTAKLMARAMIRHLKRDISDDDMAQAAY
jgi:amidohydrolase